MLADKDNYQLALNYLIRAAMLNPRSWTTLTALSGVYLALGAPEMAAHALEQARAIKPDDFSVLTTLGEVYREEREYELARDAFRQALAIEPDLEPAATGLGWICSYMGEDGEAVEVFERLVKRGTRSLDVLHALTSLPASLVSVDVLTEMAKGCPRADAGQGRIRERPRVHTGDRARQGGSPGGSLAAACAGEPGSICGHAARAAAAAGTRAGQPHAAACRPLPDGS